jgi:hypothetical protein
MGDPAGSIGAVLTVSSGSISGSTTFTINTSSGTCGAFPFTLSAGSSCTLGVNFFATNAAIQTGIMTIFSDDAVTPFATTTLTGVASITSLVYPTSGSVFYTQFPIFYGTGSASGTVVTLITSTGAFL